VIRIGFVGAGGRAGQHLETLSDLEGVDVTAICDIDRETAVEAAAPHDAAVYTDYEAMYGSADLDAVFVVLPPFAHEAQERLAAERGIDLFVEKPLALSREKAADVRDAVEENGVIAATGYQRRYAETVQRARELVAGRTLGLVEGYYKGGVPGSPGHWWRVYEKSGGQVVEQATHIYDLVRLFGGEVESVSAVGGHEIVEEIDFEDVVSTNLLHEGGTVGHVTSTSAASRHYSGVELIGDDIQLRVSGDSLSGVVDGEEIEYESEDDPSRRAVEAFVEAVETNDPSPVRAEYADGVRSLAVTLAVEESLRTGSPVSP
jgi:predicted dehydrogenase